MVKDKIIDSVIGFVPSFYARVKGSYEDKVFETMEEFGIVYEKYIEHIYSKYSSIKTLLYKNEAKNLYNFYEHVVIEGNDYKIETKNTDEIFRPNQKVIITGTGGIGKSLLMRHILVDQIIKGYSVPIFIELKSINSFNIDEFQFEDYLFEYVQNNHLDIEKSKFLFTLEKGSYTFIFDGLDEVNASFQMIVEQGIRTLADKYNKNQFVISSRPTDIFIGWSEFTEYSIIPLSKQKALSLVSKLDYDSITKKNFHKELKEKLYDNHESFASIPLLLTIMLITFEAGATIPDDLTEFYNQAFYALYIKHDASKSGYKRELAANLSPEEFKDILGYIGMKSFFSSKISMRTSELLEYLEKYKINRMISFLSKNFLEDATHSVCMMIKEGDLIRFSHRSFQEYFAGIGLSKLNDTMQRKILLSWAYNDRQNIAYNRTFITTLITQQAERTYSNLFVPIVEKMEFTYKLYNKDPDKFIPVVFAYFRIKKGRAKGENEEKEFVTFVIKSEFAPYFSSHFLILQSLHKDVSSLDKFEEVEKERLIKKLENLNKVVYSELKDQELKNDIRRYIQCWFIPRLEYLIKWKNEVVERSKTKKRSFASILDEI